MATITPLALRSPVLLPPSSASNPTKFHGFTKRPPPSRLFFPLKPFPSLSIQNPKKSIRIAASVSPITPIFPATKPTNRSPTLTGSTQPSTLTGSTRSLATLAALTIAVTKVLAQRLAPVLTAGLRFSLSTAGPVFFASLRDRPPGYLNTPLTVVAVGIKKWLDIYSGVLMVRVLLSWFPNIPWERQPLSAIRDLCDPYLNLFRNIIPPIFDTLDVSPLLAFSVLGILGSIVHGST
ncbi:PREDICTED: ylmG homolog protein 1-1, chloroplastic-like [Camelina sativa]|uniref:YlmG homolog protein 1-1, chloroplastic-like n=1 Tax=Camelina sativa TaxID=90675 RepID=A0ABM0W1H5_CAMSA|nr:PREDICTED: ylmG homolog protein 1-1, chloroplastic-like [Camelina sativa]